MSYNPKIFIASLFSIWVFIASATAKLEFEQIRKTIVTIEARVAVSTYKFPGEWSGTGFIADKKQGLIVTNSHVADHTAIGNYGITFFNGQYTEAKIIYSDPYVDFSIMQVNPQELPTGAAQIDFTEKLPKLGEEVFVVGNTEGQGFSFHSGRLTNLYEIEGVMPQGSYVINMNTAGGSSGSPILNSESKAIGVLYGGGKTHSIAFKGKYVQYILNALKNKQPLPQRKSIGIITSLYSLDKAVKHRNFPIEYVKQYMQKWPHANNKAIIVKSILAGSPATNILKPGDIIYSIENKEIGPDLVLFDSALNETDKAEVQLKVIRDSKMLDLKITPYDLQQYQINDILDFAGGLFFPANDYIAAYTGIKLGNITLILTKPGSSFSAISEKYYQEGVPSLRTHIKKLANIEINTIQDLIKATKEAIKQKYVNLEYVNHQPYFPNFSGGSFISSQDFLIQDITVDSIDSNPRILKFNDLTKEWEANNL